MEGKRVHGDSCRKGLEFANGQGSHFRKGQPGTCSSLNDYLLCMRLDFGSRAISTAAVLDEHEVRTSVPRWPNSLS